MPDYNFKNCPNRQQDLIFGRETSWGCLLTKKPVADKRGEDYEPCDFVGCNYLQCPRFTVKTDSGACPNPQQQRKFLADLTD